MLFISHRGNLSGPQPENENKVSYIQAAIDKGFSVEVDVIDFDGHDTFTLGHDKGQEKVKERAKAHPAEAGSSMIFHRLLRKS